MCLGTCCWKTLSGVWARTVWATGPFWPSSVRGGLDSAQWIGLISNLSVVIASTAFFIFFSSALPYLEADMLDVAVALVVKLLRQQSTRTAVLSYVTSRKLQRGPLACTTWIVFSLYWALPSCPFSQLLGRLQKSMAYETWRKFHEEFISRPH